MYTENIKYRPYVIFVGIHCVNFGIYRPARSVQLDLGHTTIGLSHVLVFGVWEYEYRLCENTRQLITKLDERTPRKAN